jgi:hypothetical protein
MRATHRRAVFGALTAVLALTVAACGGADSLTGSGAQVPTTPVGAYGLSTLGGKPMPVTMFADTAFTDVVSAASLALTADGKFLAVTTTNETVAGNLSVYVDSSTGTWKQVGSTSALSFTITDDPAAAGVELPGVWSGNTISMTDADGLTWVYSRK